MAQPDAHPRERRCARIAQDIGGRKRRILQANAELTCLVLQTYAFLPRMPTRL